MANEKNLLVTGFEPFGGQRINPSWVCVDMLPDEIDGCKIAKRELPVVWFEALDKLYALIDEVKPRAVLCVGQAGGESALNIERVGINLCNGTDNAGTKLCDVPVFHQAPAAYFSTLPYEKMLSALKENQIDGKFSFSAGTYLCNHVLYGALHRAATAKPGVIAGFLHVPMLPQQVLDTGGRSMPLEKTALGVELCVRELCAVL